MGVIGFVKQVHSRQTTVGPVITAPQMQNQVSGRSVLEHGQTRIVAYSLDAYAWAPFKAEQVAAPPVAEPQAFVVGQCSRIARECTSASA